MNLISIILFVAGIFAGIKLLSAIKAKWGVAVERNAWYISAFICTFYDLATDKIGGAVFMVACMILCYLLFSFSDKLAVKSYKSKQKELSRLDNAGWGQIYRANVLRGSMGQLWRNMPEKCHQELLAWEKSLDSAN